MIEVQKTDEFDAWLSALTDHKAVAKIVTRIDRLALLCGGDKASQEKDIKRAKQIAAEL